MTKKGLTEREKHCIFSGNLSTGAGPTTKDPFKLENPQ